MVNTSNIIKYPEDNFNALRKNIENGRDCCNYLRCGRCMFYGQPHCDFESNEEKMIVYELLAKRLYGEPIRLEEEN